VSLDAGIRHRKEWRKPYRRSGRFDPQCRPHGGCSWCHGSRMANTRRREAAMDAQLEDLDECPTPTP
jgi:hypothetical protein